MLVYTRIVVQYASRRVVERDWRIVVVPDEDASSGATVLSLFLCDYCKQQGHSVLLKRKKKLLPSSSDDNL